MIYTSCKQMQAYNDLSELLPWLESLVNQLPQQRMIAATMEQLQVQSNWLKVSQMYTVVETWGWEICLKQA